MRKSNKVVRLLSLVVAFAVLSVGLLATPAQARKVTGTSKSDNLRGSKKDDTINGGAGNDTISGREGHDKISGGPGNDRLEGGKGSDAYFFGSKFGRDSVIERTGTDRLVFTKDRLRDVISGKLVGPNLVIKTKNGEVTLHSTEGVVEIFQFSDALAVWDSKRKRLVNPSSLFRAGLKKEAKNAQTEIDRETARAYSSEFTHSSAAKEFDRQIINEQNLTILNASFSKKIKDRVLDKLPPLVRDRIPTNPKDFIPQQIAKKILKEVLKPTPLNVGEDEELERDRKEKEKKQREFNESSDRRDNLEKEGIDPSVRDDDQNTGPSGIL